MKKRTLLQRIVNVFLYAGIILIILFLVLLGFSQTSTFREYLRTTVCNIANKELNGHLSIGRIDGTILSSIVLRNTVVNMGRDTLLNAGVIELKTSPLQIFLKRIYIRKVELSNTKIAFTADSAGVLNISKLLPPTPKDTTHSKFPFKIVAPDIKLDNIDFAIRSSNLPAGNQYYDYLNMNDFVIKHLNFDANAAADIGNNSYELKINNFSFDDNLNRFSLKKLSGEIFVDTNGAFVNDLQILTGGSDISLKAKIDDFNLFDSIAFSNINNAKINVELKADKFNFDDLSTFVPPTDILEGTASVYLEASGSLKDLAFSRLEVNYFETHLEARGRITDVTDVNRMNIAANFFRSSVRESDADKLLPSIGIPSYKDFGTVTFDTLVYEGNPLNFRTKAFVKTNNGSADINASLDLRKQDMIYNISAATRNLDLTPLTGFGAILNSHLMIKGAGTSPDRLNSIIRFNGSGSYIAGNQIDSLRLHANADSGKIICGLLLNSNSGSANLSGSFDFANKNKPSYTLKGKVQRLNLAEFSHDTSMSSNLNLSLDGSGDNFNPDSLDLYLTLDLKKSVIRGVNIDSARAIADIRSNDNGERVINIISDLADITITGKFSTLNAVNLISKEAGILATASQNKLNEILYPDSVFNKQVQNGISVLQKSGKTKKVIQPSLLPADIKYYVEFKNFDLLTLLLGNNHLSVDGDMSGEIKNANGNVSLTSNTNLNYLKYWGKDNVFFLSNVNLGLNVSNNLDSTSLNDISASLSASTDRLFAGSDLTNLNLILNLQNQIAGVSFSGSMGDNTSAKLSGKIDLTDNSVQMNLDTLQMIYNDFALTNRGNVKINYSKDKIVVDEFDMARDGGDVSIKGSLVRYGNQDLKIGIKNFSGYDLSTNLFKLKPENSAGGTIHLNAEVKGDFSNPQAVINLGMDDISFKNKNFGMLIGNMNYENQNLAVDVKYLDSLININKPKLVIKGDIPVDLAFTGVQERFVKNKQIDLSLNAANFDLSLLSNAFPEIEKLTGYLIADLKITGTPENLYPSGTVAVKNSSFLADANNMEYTAGIKLSVKDNSITIDSLRLANAPGTTGGGVITGSGKADLKNFTLSSVIASLNGSLKVLSDDSKLVSPNIYGDLVVQTNGDIKFSMDSKGSFLHMPIIVDKANLTFPPSQSAYQSNTSNFIYRFLSNGSSENKNELDFERLVRLSKEMNSQNKAAEASLNSSLNYSIDVSVQNEAALKFILSKELNQNLTALISGNIHYDNLGGKKNIQGELTLLEGSKLELFLKTFDASGTIRFESELSNPYLNIVAVYRNYYTPETGGQDEPVEVRIKLSGPLNDLSQSFLQNKNNISVYVGSDDINNNKPDPTKDISDAVMFVLTGKFSSGLTSQQQQQAISQSGAVNTTGSLASNTASSLAGSLLGMVAQKLSGGYVSSVDIRSVGSITKFNLMGKVNKFRYAIGGSQDVFQDLSQVNMQIEYPLFQNLLLRYERKEAINQTSSVTNEMINEVGLKYRFEF